MTLITKGLGDLCLTWDTDISDLGLLSMSLLLLYLWAFSQKNSRENLYGSTCLEHKETFWEKTRF